jgi:hypothetical protein
MQARRPVRARHLLRVLPVQPRHALRLRRRRLPEVVRQSR